MKILLTQFMLAVSGFVPLAAPLLRANEPLIVGQASRAGDEATIRELEHRNALAVLHLDYAALENLWSERLVVATPGNLIAPNRAAVFEVFRRFHGPLYTSYDKNIECIIFDGDVTTVMGVETVGPRATPGKTAQQRYTNVWKLDNGTWRLIARQATMIPGSAPSGLSSAAPPSKQ